VEHSVVVHELMRLVVRFGYIVILVGVMADSFGIPVPGEVMLLTASMFAGASSRLSIVLVVGTAALGATMGDNLSFALGRGGGARLLDRWGDRVHLDRRRRRLARFLFQRWGGNLVLLGRLVPVVHIATAFLAGAHEMPWWRFALADAVGCLTWAAVLGTAGYLFGRAAVHAGSIVFGLSLPIALIVVVGAVLAFRLAENRLQRAAESSREGTSDAADTSALRSGK
jgi:membrane protein DedA with SNARE-associated domain